jgi:general stress protein 26
MKVSSFSDIEKEFIDRVHASVWCSVATLDTKNRPRSRILHPIWEGKTGWVGTRRYSLKAKHIEHNPYVSLAYISDVARPVYVDCKAAWEESLTNKKRVWDLFKSASPPLGFDFGTLFENAEAPGFGVLKLTPWRVELFDISIKDMRRVWALSDSL